MGDDARYASEAFGPRRLDGRESGCLTREAFPPRLKSGQLRDEDRTA